MDLTSLSKNLKKDKIEVVNKQNLCNFNENYFSRIDTEEKAYWLGFLYADGAVGKNTNIVELSLKSSDISHLEKYKKSLQFNEDKHIYCDNVRCRISHSSKKLKNDLINLGCFPQKSLILAFPTDNQVPSILIHHFVRGYIDGDGSVMIGKNHKNIYTKPRMNILGTKEFLIGLVNAMGWEMCKYYKKGNVYSIEWNGKRALKYLDDIYLDATIYLDRKYLKYLTLKDLNK